MSVAALESVLRALADGSVHSGEALANRLGVTRAAVWKRVARLKERGLDVRAVPGIGYRLPRPLELLDADAIRGRLTGRGTNVRLERFTEIDSTNRRLLERPPTNGDAITACVAEYQSAGRGRRGRSWAAPLGASLCLSVGYRFGETPPDLSAVPLAAGVVIRRIVEQQCGVALQLKWPNDLVWQHRKLGGLLVEIVGETPGRCVVVAGLGINVAVPPEVLRQVSDWPAGAVDLRRATAGSPPSRNALAAALIDALATLLRGYATHGFSPYQPEWQAADYLADRRVEVDVSGRPLQGVARGIDADGALLIDTARGRKRVVSGDVRVRSVD